MKNFLASLSLILLLAGAASAQKSPVFTTDKGAIRGYDPVAYFQEGKPVKGKPGLVYTWQEAQWHFVSPQNLEAFKADPEKYAPQYGGYCAYGTAEGHKAPTDPQAWTVKDGKLYLNYNKDVQKTWKKDEDGYIQKASQNWPQLKDKE